MGLGFRVGSGLKVPGRPHYPWDLGIYKDVLDF